MSQETTIERLFDKLDGLKEVVTRIEERLEGHLDAERGQREEVLRSINVNRKLLVGNGSEGLVAKVERLDRESAERRADRRKLFSTIVTALVIQAVLFVAGLAWIGAQVALEQREVKKLEEPHR